MPKYGEYQTVSEINRGVLGTVWSARRETDNPQDEPRFAVKTCKPDIDIAGAEQAALAVKLFLEAAQVQQRLAKAQPAIWATIHHVAKTASDDGWGDGGGGAGGGEGGAYAVTDFFPRSAQRMVSARAELDGASLARLMSAALAAAADIQQRESRPHGNLKPANLLIADGANGNDLSEARVLVTDPLASAQLPTDALQTVDQRGLGEVLFQLVTWQPYQQRGGWPITSSPAWNRLGSAAGAKWLGLCNRLLDPNADGTVQPMPFAEIEAALRELGTARANVGGGGGKKLVLIGGAAAALLALAAGGYFLTRPKETGTDKSIVDNGNTTTADGQIDPTAWRRLCEDYSTWLGPLALDLSRKPEQFEGKTRAESYAGAVPELAPVLRELSERVESFDPRKLVPGGAASGERLEVLKQSVPASLLTSDGAKKVGEAVAFTNRVRSALFGSSSLILAGAGGQGDVAAAWSSAGWTKAAELITSSAREIGSPAEKSETTRDALDKAVLLRVHVGKIEQVRRAIEEQIKVINAPGDAILGTFEDWSKTYPAERLSASANTPSEVLDSLRNSLGAVRDTGATLVNFISDNDPAAKWTRVCVSLFAQSSEYQSLAAKPPSAERFESWRLLAIDRRFEMPTRDQDPRRGDASLERARSHVERLKGISSPELPEDRITGVLIKANEAFALMGSPPADRATLAPRADELVKQWWAPELMDNCDSAQQVIARGRAGSYQTIVKHLSDAAAELDGALATLLVSNAEHITRLFVDDHVGLELAELKQAWKTLRGPTPAADTPNLSQRLTEADGVLKQLRALGNNVPEWSPPAGVINEPLRVAMKAAFDNKRANLIGSLINSKSAQGKLPDPAWSETDYSAINGSLATETEALVQVSDAADRLAGALAGAYGSDEPRPDGKTVNELLGDLKSNSAYEAVRSGLASIESRVAELQRIESLTDTAELVTLASQTRPDAPEVSLAAWRRLAATRSGAWPASIADLDDEVRVSRPIRVLVDSLKDTLRPEKSALVASIGAERARRWKQFVATATTPKDIADAFSAKYTRAEDGGVGVTQDSLVALAPGSPLDAAVLFRWKLRDLISSADSLDEAALKAATQELMRTARLNNSFAAGSTMTFINDLNSLVNQPVDTAPKIDVTKLGPGSVGWACAPSADGSVLSFSKAGTTIDFILVSPPGVAPAYLARTELSVAQFKSIIDSSPGLGGTPAWDAVAEYMEPKPGILARSTQDPRDGPRAWLADGIPGRLSTPGEDTNQVEDWINETPRKGKESYLEAYRNKSDSHPIKQDMQASKESPMQYIPPTAAFIASRLVGCRFPTTAEWRAAAQSAGPTRNLRDATWKRQFDHKQVIARGESFYINVDGAFGDNPAIQGDDGVLWFMAVRDGAAQPNQFAHIRGNVAEYALGDTVPMPPVDSASGCANLLDSNQGVLFIVGGSSLGPPGDLDKAVPASVASPDFKTAATGWPDVGIRLAFSAEGAALKLPSFAELLRTRLDSFAYGTAP